MQESRFRDLQIDIFVNLQINIHLIWSSEQKLFRLALPIQIW